MLSSYLLVAHAGGPSPERLLLAASLSEQVLGAGNVTILAIFSGLQLRDVRYERLFTAVPGPGEQIDLTGAYRLVTDDMVSLADGSGIVHIAPAYGDLESGGLTVCPPSSLWIWRA